ncbi:MAG: D-hexose-6-phosphate mutarotase [Moraxellaceae bacterium]
MALPAGITEVSLGDAGLRGLRIETPLCTALLSLQGGQLLQFQPIGKAPLLWLSEDAIFRPGKSARGGIPLCFPWFGTPADKDKPAHGFARHRLWTLTRAQRDGDTVTLELTLHDDADTKKLWPHAFLATQTLTLGSDITLTLSVENRDENPFSFTFAQHSYFPVSDITRTRVEGLEGRPYFDALQDWKILESEAGGIRFAAETDRVYEGASGHYCIVDEAEGKRIVIASDDCKSAIVWNPWSEKNARMGDMGAEGWRGMLCVESGNTGKDGITLAAGEQRRFTLKLASG